MLFISERNTAEVVNKVQQRKMSVLMRKYGIHQVSRAHVQIYFMYCGQPYFMAILVPESIHRVKKGFEITLAWNHYERIQAWYDWRVAGFFCYPDQEQFTRLALDRGVMQLDIIDQKKVNDLLNGVKDEEKENGHDRHRRSGARVPVAAE